MDYYFLAYVGVGLIAQLIDGALGMAYGVSSTSFLLAFGVVPAVASASVHTAEMFTTLVSGVAHWRFGNVDWALVKKLTIPGVLGGILGAYMLSSVPTDTIKPFVSGYLLIMGILILLRAFKNFKERELRGGLIPLGAVGGFLDAIGGGGWGPVVTTTLVASGNNPRFAIGSVNFAEFFITVAISAMFFATIEIMSHWQVILGLLVGGVVAAPVAAYVCKKLPTKTLMIVVGIVIVLLQARIFYQLWAS